VFVGRTVLDAGGDCIGQVSTLYLDLDTGVVAFAGVAMIRRGRRRIVFVPLRGATLRPASITVACGKLLARRAVSVRPGQSLPVGAAADLFAHYDLPYVPPEPIGGRRLVPYI
jgi:hypothetical protein